MKHLKKYNSRYPTHNENSQSNEYEYIKLISEEEFDRFTRINSSTKFSKETQRELFRWAELLSYDSFSWERTISIPSTQASLNLSFSLKHVRDFEKRFIIKLETTKYHDDWFIVRLSLTATGIREKRFYLCDEYDSMLTCLNNVFKEVSEKYMNVRIK